MNSGLLSGLLEKRQFATPNIPSSANTCDGPCTTASTDFNCGAISCICVSSHLQDLANCFACATPYIQPSDPSWVSDAQQELAGLVQDCQAEGYTVATPSFDGSAVATETAGGATPVTETLGGAGTTGSGGSPTTSPSSPGQTVVPPIGKKNAAGTTTASMLSVLSLAGGAVFALVA